MPASIVQAPSAKERRVLFVRAVEEPVNPIYYNNMSLGLLWINAAVKQLCPDVESRILDWNSLGATVIRQRYNWIDQRSELKRRFFSEYLEQFQPAIVAVSAYSCYMPLAIDIADLVRRYAPDVPVVLGGFHSTAYPEAVDQFEMFDIFVRGEGVRVAPKLIHSLLDGDPPLETVASLSFRAKDGSITTTPSEDPPLDLDENPPIDWSDVDPVKYRENNVAQMVDDLFLRFRKGKLVLYEASQGCRYKCAFCEQRMQHGRGARRFSPERVISDLRRLKDHFDPEGVFFTDEYIHYEREWFIELLDQLKRHPELNLKYTMGVKGDELDFELIDRIVDSGVVQLSSYLESGSERIRRAMRKPIKFDKHLENMEYASKAGLIVFCGFVVGWPTETLEEVELSYECAERDFIDHAHMLPLSYLGKAEIGKHLKDLGIAPNSPEYFRMLNNPTDICLTEYTQAEYEYFVVDRIKKLNRKKLLSATTRRKLRRLGWQLVEIPAEADEQIDAGQADLISREVSESVPDADRTVQQIEALIEAKLLRYVSTSGGRLINHQVTSSSEQGHRVPRITLRFAVGDEVLPIYLSGRRTEDCFHQTRFFNVRHGATEPLSTGVEQALDHFLRRFGAWERKAIEVNVIRHFERLLKTVPDASDDGQR